MTTNITVVLHGAFDTPYKPAKWSKTGWWRLIQNLSYHNSSQYVFEEKQAQFRRKKDKLTLVRDATKLKIKPIDLGDNKSDLKDDVVNTTTNWPIVVAATLLVLFLTISLAAFITKLFRKRRIKYVDNEEMRDFYQGTTSLSSDVGNGSVPEAHRTPYNTDLELAKSDFKLESNTILGSGAFGTVVQGVIRNFKGSGEDVSVAVKTTKLSSPSTAITGMMSEIKVLGYLGKHDHIVNLIGAYTKEIRKGKIYMFLEICSLGSLDKHLRQIRTDAGVSLAAETNLDNREEIANQIIVEEETTTSYYNQCKSNKYENVGVKASPFTADLYRWSSEIAHAMDFIASKNVVHADLATRNVLLTADKRAKISDFGLSRRLYEYEMYLKKQQEPLPWRWMAPESIRRMEFTEKSDVWAFGITLWEIYSLGDLPYGGLSWTPNFVTQLSQGLHLEEPAFTERGMYSHMLRCWNMDPSRRPTFSDLKSSLQ